MKKRFVSLLVAFLFAIGVQVKAQTGLPGSSVEDQTNPTTVDCSDPLLAMSSQCSGLGGLGQTSLYPSTSGMPPSMNGMGGMSGQSGQTGMPGSQSSVFTDNEYLVRQNAMRQQPTMQFPREALTEFQKFIASTTGQVLPIYGENLFREVPSTFAPLDLTPVPPTYILGPDDEIRIRVWGQVNLRANLRVDRSGEIYLPQVGPVHVAGLPFADLDAHLRQAIARVYKNFDLTADVGQIRSIQVYVSGQARRPGLYTVSSLSTLVDALFASGGPSPSGSLRHIEVRRGGAVVADFDLYALLLHGDKSKDMSLESGDVIFIPPVGPEAAVTGSVKSPAIYELREGETLGDEIADAGGASVVADQARISIERIDDHRDRAAMEVAWDQSGLATIARDGDLVRVFSIVPMYQKTVTLRGNTANPGRFAWHPGMKVSDLIPDKDSLITRNYWWRRAQLGLPAPEFQPLENFPKLLQPSAPQELPRARFLGQTRQEATPGSAGASGTGGNSTSTETTGNSADALDSVDETGTGAQGQDAAALAAQQGTGATNTANSQNSGTAAIPASQTAGSAALAVEQPTSSMQGQAATRTEVGPVAPEIDWDYAVIERMDPQTLKTALIPFDLGRLVLQHDESQNLPLLPGDVVSIFSQDDVQVPLAQQTKFVRLDGEFAHAGTYTVLPGETLRELVKRAGGFTSNAYLYGSEFTRRSARRLQQRRLDEYVQSLEIEMQRGNLALASGAVSTPQDLANAAAAQNSETNIISRLRQMRATGRIVLEFQSASNGLDALPNIQLEDGDRFVVPPVPASINVVGAVYDQNSFLYQKGRRAGDYLHLAGGPNRDADKSHTFIIRADGSVVSRESESGIWGNEFANLPMNPGDTIVMPEKVFKPSGMRAFLDWSQIFSQFALGAATINLLY
jgi:protein involved in polysaccharide export with SLBB domain